MLLGSVPDPFSPSRCGSRQIMRIRIHNTVIYLSILSIYLPVDGVDYPVSGKLVPRPATNHTELVADIAGHITRQPVLVDTTAVTLYTREHLTRHRTDRLSGWLSDC